VVDTQPDGKPVAPGTPGEIEVRGPNVFAEYWDKPDATRNTFRAPSPKVYSIFAGLSFRVIVDTPLLARFSGYWARGKSLWLRVS
jgi:acyl-CoA synthetase (AMP-forming)/AMP-acid ligase II